MSITAKGAWRAFLWTVLRDRADKLGVDVVLPVYWRGVKDDRVDGLLVGDELRVRVDAAMIAELDRVPADYSTRLATEDHRRLWHGYAEAIRASVGKTVSLNQYASGLCIPLKAPDRGTTTLNVYVTFEIAPLDPEVSRLLNERELGTFRLDLANGQRQTVSLKEFGLRLAEMAGVDVQSLSGSINQDGRDPLTTKSEEGPLRVVAEAEESDVEEVVESVWTRHRSVIFFGPPGTGKSHQVQEIVSKHLAAAHEHVKRVTFHPEYSYFDFVGSYRPAVGWLKTTAQFTDADGVTHDREPRTYYRFEPGPFSHALALAARQKDEPVVLIVEEINRGNCAAIFGDVFQLLDRVNDARRPEREGWSEYAIVPSAEWAGWLEAQVPNGSDVYDRKTRQLRLPGNLYIYATMNTSDQSLFPMDTAFRRRWGMSYSGVDTHAQPTSKVPLHGGDEAGVQWIALMRALNKEIVDHTRTDDKQMGPWFIRPPAGETVVDRIEFKSKVLYYLWATVFRDRPARVFHQDVDTYEALLARYDKGQHVFQTSVLAALGVSENQPPAAPPASQA